MPMLDTQASRTSAESSNHVASAGADKLTSQERLAQQLFASIDALERQVAAIVQPLTPSQRAARAAGGGWSVDQILEHLCLANADYLDSMEQAQSRSNRSLRRGAWRATLGGWLLARAMQSGRRSSAPSNIVPSSTPRDAVLEAMLGSLDRLRHLIDRASSSEWRDVRMTSPYARWLRLNFGDAALIVVGHAERHARQMARVASAVRE